MSLAAFFNPSHLFGSEPKMNHPCHLADRSVIPTIANITHLFAQNTEKDPSHLCTLADWILTATELCLVSDRYES